MIEPLYHLFVWIVSPAAVGLTAYYALQKREFFLGAFASASMLLLCAGIAMWMFDGYLMFYQLIYTALIAVPASMLLVTAFQAAARLSKLIVLKLRPADTN
ncbi:hypothetical protein [uncultured Sphingomonas sp.]|uniref:hypothetical protein n=1 Tax=uncultured Sphingomonas sp. TaxID=158754 RepID=UPI0025DDE626|nr:hypothetical protein [uncultured Sphingomonas sp.]